MDTIVLAMGTRSWDILREEMKDGPVTTFVLGDAKEPRRAVDAIVEESEIARTI